jgi:hypothetical protein
MNVPEEMEQSSEEELDPLAHLRPPFEKFWSDTPYPPVPNVPSVQVQSPAAENKTLYFAYGKDMDVSYLTTLFSSEPSFVAIAKISKYRWVVEQSGKFPKIVSSDEEKQEQEHVYGLVYRLSQSAWDIMNVKAEKRGLRMKEKEIQMYEKSGMPGVWNTPLVSTGSENVQVMVGTLESGEGQEGVEEGNMQGSKKRKVMGGLLWAASLVLPEAWKEEIRNKLGGGIKGPEDTGYWVHDEDRKDGEAAGKKGRRRSTRLRSKGKGKK